MFSIDSPELRRRAAPPAAERRGNPILLSLAAALAYLVFWQIAPRVRTESAAAFLVSSLISLALIVWFAAQYARSARHGRHLLLHILLAAAAAIPLRILLAARYPAAVWLYMAVPGLMDLLFVWLAASIGVAMSLLLRGVNMIPPVAVVLALVDVWTVLLGGPVQQIMESQSPAARAVTQAMTVQLPAPRTTGAAPAALLVGFADFLFIAFFVAAICRFVPDPRTYPRLLKATVLVLCAYMALVFFAEFRLPALIPLSVVMIALHRRHFHYARSEAFALLYAAALIAVIAAGFWYFARTDSSARKLPAQEPGALTNGERIAMIMTVRKSSIEGGGRL